VNLLPELRVTVDLMTQGRWLGERFVRRGGWFARLGLSVSALPSETNEFHKRLSSADDWSRLRGTKNDLRKGTTHSSVTSDAFKAPQTQLEAKVAKMVCISLAPARLDRYPRGFTGHVADPVSSIVSRSLPLGSTATLAVLPAMSLIPSAPLYLGSSRSARPLPSRLYRPCR
jgi:hypothetical protein